MKSEEFQQEWTLKSSKTMRLTRTPLSTDEEEINRILKELMKPPQSKPSSNGQKKSETEA